MKQISVILVLGIVFGFGFFAGHRYTAEKLAPSSIDFGFAEKLISLVDDELHKYHQSSSFVYSIKTTLRGPVLDISASDSSGPDKKKFEREILLHNDVADKVLTFQANGLLDENMEKVRPLAKEIAKKIIEVQPNR